MDTMFKARTHRIRFNALYLLLILLPVMLLSIAPLAMAAGPAPDMEWIRQFGSSSDERVLSVSVDSTGIYVAGYTWGTLPGQSSSGGADAFVRKYDASGNEVWTRQFGSSSSDEAYGVSVDATAVYVAGTTGGTLPGQSKAGQRDIFVRKYDTNGSEVWTRQFGFGTSGYEDSGVISVDASGVYVAGITWVTVVSADAFVRKYDTSGNEMWTRQFGSSSSDYAFSVSVDATGVYVAGQTLGTLPGQSSSGSADAFVRKYDSSGSEVWTRQFGSSSEDRAYAISVDATGVYVAGYTAGTFPGQSSAGSYDTFICKYDASGSEVWTRQSGSSSTDWAWGISVDTTGVYVAGETWGTLSGQSSAGGADAFVRKYDASGNEVWISQFGTSSNDFTYSVSVEATGVYAGGYTSGTFPGQSSAGGTDAFVVKFAAPNRPPVLSPIGNQTVNEGQVLTFTISATDPDGDPLIYSASNLPSLASFNPATKTFSWTPTYEQAGTYPGVCFTVSDGKVSAFEDITITVNDVVIQATVDIDPNTLNLKSQSDKNAITACIELPAGYDVNKIDIATVKLNVLGTLINAQTAPTSVGDYDGDKIPDRMVKFDRQAVITALAGKTGDVSLIVTGQLTDGRSFSGTDTIRIINPGK